MGIREKMGFHPKGESADKQSHEDWEEEFERKSQEESDERQAEEDRQGAVSEAIKRGGDEGKQAFRETTGGLPDLGPNLARHELSQWVDAMKKVESRIDETEAAMPEVVMPQTPEDTAPRAALQELKLQHQMTELQLDLAIEAYLDNKFPTGDPPSLANELGVRRYDQRVKERQAEKAALLGES